MRHDEVWSRLGIAPTRDEREIRKAYAGQLRKNRPDDDAEAFQKLRQAYERALWLAQAGVDDASFSPSPVADVADADDVEPTSVPETEGKESVSRLEPAPAEVPAPDLETAPALAEAAESAPEKASSRFAHTPPRLWISSVDLWMRSGNADAAARSLDQILKQDLSLAAAEELEQELARWLAKQEEPPLALVKAVAERFDWLRRANKIQEQLPAEALPLIGRLRREAAKAAWEPAVTPGSWAFYRWIFQTLICLILPGTLLRMMPAGSDRGHEGLAYLALLAPLIVEVVRSAGEPSLGRYLQWLPLAGRWTVIVLAFLAQIQVGSTANYPLWCLASLFAILLTFGERQPIPLLIVDLAGYATFLGCLVHQVQASAESPFGYVFALPLLFSRSSLFWPAELEEAAPKTFQILFVLAVFFSTLPKADMEERRIFVGIALVLLTLFLHSWRSRPRHLLLICPLPWAAAHLLDTTFLASPLLLLLYVPVTWYAHGGLAKLAGRRAPG